MISFFGSKEASSNGNSGSVAVTDSSVVVELLKFEIHSGAFELNDVILHRSSLFLKPMQKCGSLREFLSRTGFSLIYFFIIVAPIN